MISSELQSFSDMLFQVKGQVPKGVWTPAGTMGELRAGNDAMMGNLLAMAPLPEELSVEDGSVAGIGGEWYRIPNDDGEKLQGKVLLYAHGGGFENGTVASRRYLAAGLAWAAKVDCFSLDYTQWPEGAHPVALNEALDVFRALERQYGAGNVMMGGESAGAMLTLATTLWLKDHGETMPAKAALIGPVIDCAEKLDSRFRNEAIDPMLYGDIDEQMAQRYFAGANLKSPYVSARYGNYEGFPETVITVGTEEVLYDDAVILHELLDAAKVANELLVYEGAFHTFQVMPTPESARSIAEVGAFLRR